MSNINTPIKLASSKALAAPNALHHWTHSSSKTLTYNLAGELVSDTDALGNTTTYTYSPLGEIASITDPLGNITTLEYYPGTKLVKTARDAQGNAENFIYDLCGNLTSFTDRVGLTTAFEYDPLNRMTKVIHPDSSFKAFTYNGKNKVTSITDERGHITKYSYDLSNRVVSYTDPLGKVTKYAYDKIGNPIQEVERDGTVSNYAYDPLSNLVKMSYSDNKQVELAYNSLSQLTNIKDWSGETKAELDALGRVTSVTYPSGDTLSFDWTHFNQKSAITYPCGQRLDYHFDNLQRLSKITDSAGNTTSYTYNEIDKVLEQTFPNGTQANYSYTERGEVEKLIYSSGSEILDELNYTYDPSLNTTSILRTTAGNTTKTFYAYDPFNRLVETRQDSTTTSYSWDGAGNRATKTVNGEVTHYSYNDFNQLLSKVSPAAKFDYSYDQRGNLLSILKDGEATHCYVFDARDRLVQATNPAGDTSTYLYNGLNARVGIEQTIDGQTTKTEFLSDITLPYNDTLSTKENGTLTNYIWGQPDCLVGTLGDDPHYFLTDKQTSVINATDKQGQSQSSFVYSDFGKPLQSELPTFSYTGYQYDPVSELYFAQARYYDPISGRFNAKDLLHGLLDKSETLNRYTYCLGNPVKYTDPTGLTPKIPAALLYAPFAVVAAPGAPFMVVGALYGLGSVYVSSLQSDESPSFQRYISSMLGNAAGFHPLDVTGGIGVAVELGVYDFLTPGPVLAPPKGETFVNAIKDSVSAGFYDEHKYALERLFNRSDMPKFDML